MRIRMLETVPTVGLMLNKGDSRNVQPMLAEALIGRGQAEDAFKVKGPKAPEKSEMVKPETITRIMPLIEKKPAKKKPAKKKAAKKPARKKAK